MLYVVSICTFYHLRNESEQYHYLDRYSSKLDIVATPPLFTAEGSRSASALCALLFRRYHLCVDLIDQM